MRVLKRNGQYEDVSFDKILTRIRALSQGSEFDRTLSIDDTLVAQKVVQIRTCFIKNQQDQGFEGFWSF